MIDDLRAIAIFAETVRRGSFRGAAGKLGLSPSAVSYHVSELENRLGTPLLYRSTRKLSLTSEGERLYHHAQAMVEHAQRGLQDIDTQGEQLRGRLAISATTVLMQAPLNRLIGDFYHLHPDLDFSLTYSDERSDILEEGIDLALRAGAMGDSSLMSRRIGSINRKVVCSSCYAQKLGEISQPEDLAQAHWLLMDMLPPQKVFRNEAGDVVSIDAQSRLRVNSVQAMTQFCLQGLGLCTPPDFLVQEALEDGRLVEILPDWSVGPMPLYAVWHGGQVQNPAVRQLMDFITSHS